MCHSAGSQRRWHPPVSAFPSLRLTEFAANGTRRHMEKRRVGSTGMCCPGFTGHGCSLKPARIAKPCKYVFDVPSANAVEQDGYQTPGDAQA